MPGMHGSCCPCGFRYIPHTQGYTCEGAHHHLNRAGEDGSQEQGGRDRDRRRQIMNGQDMQRAADVQRQREKQREREQGKVRESEARRRKERDEEREREREIERQKQKDKEAQWARDDRKQKADFERQRGEALARVRLTLEAPPASTAAPSSRGERRRESPPPEEPVDELDADPVAMPWLQTPATKQREPELVRARAKKSKAPWE